jgi:CRP/FNR family cyclic AMP-dependent transcriptional regulator
VIRRLIPQLQACENSSMTESSDIVTESYPAQTAIFFEGDIDFHFYIVQSGRVQIYTKTESGGRVNITVIEEGESFGEFALLDKQARSASAEAMTDCVLVKVSEAGYHQLLSELPVWASCMLQSFADRLKRMNQLIKNMP